MTTIHDAIRHTEAQFDGAKRRAAALREASKADSKNTVLRLDVVNADADAAAVGRELVEYRFIRDLDNWLARHARYEIVADELIAAAAPRVRGFQTTDLIPDWEWVGAMHLKRAGHVVPSGWLSSETGEPLPNESKSDSKRAA
jgi:hypothetical protein